MSNSPKPLLFAGYSNLTGPARNIGLVLDEAASRGLQTELIPHDADDPAAVLDAARKKAGRDVDALLVAFSHPPPGQTFSPKEAAIVRSVPAATLVANVADIPEHEQFGKENPMVGRTDMVFMAGNWYEERITPEWGYRENVHEIYPGPPPHLDAAINAMKHGKNERTARKIQTTDGLTLSSDKKIIYVQGDKDLEHIAKVIEGVRAGIGQLSANTRKRIALVYRPHPGADDFYKRLNVLPATVSKMKEQIALLLAPALATLDLTHLPSDIPQDPYLFGAADVSLTTRGATSSWVAALTRTPTVSVIQKGDIEDWFVVKKDGTEVTDYAGLPATLGTMLTQGGQEQLWGKQARNFFPYASLAGENTAARMINSIVAEVRQRLV